MAASGLLLLLLLGLFARQMEPDWTYNVQYSYGWMVLPGALYLGYLRWKDRPAPGSPRIVALLPALLLLLALLAFIRPVQEANPDWRLISWTLGTTLCLLGLLLAYFAGGRSWLRHFAFAFLFPLVAIPWPTWLESDLIQFLTRVVTGITVEGLNLCGVPALQHGNLIELSQTWIGVNEACSGVRSFQATLMITLFLGEMFRFGWKLRLGLIGAGLALALLGNVLRAFFLSWITANGDGGSLDRWHDPAGFSILAGVFILLLLASFTLDSRLPKKAGTTASGSARQPARVSWGIAAAILGWLILAEIGTEGWYRSHEKGVPPAAIWSLNLPRANASLITAELPAEAQAMLRYDEGYKAAWENEGTRWATIFLRWKAGRNAAQLAKSHPPEVCLSAGNMQLSKDHGSKEFLVQGIPLHFRVLEFAAASGPVYVFYMLWEDRVEVKSSGPEDYSSRSRWEAVRSGRRHLGQRLVEVAIAHSPDLESAVAQFQKDLPALIHFETTQSLKK